MIKPFDTNRDPGDEQDDDGYSIVTRLGRNYYLELDENGCLDIPKDRDNDDTTS